MTHDDTAVVGIVRESSSAPAAPLTPNEVLPAVTATTTTVTLGEHLVVFDVPTGQVHILNAVAALVWDCVPEASGTERLIDVA